MIIWGWRGITSTVDNATFHCPRCSNQRTGKVKQVRKYFTLYFIPIIPLDIAGRYVECETCAGEFGEEILNYDPEKERLETQTQMMRVMILSALADGHVDPAERAEIKSQFLEMSGLPLPDTTLDQEIALAADAKVTLNQYVSALASSLSPHGKALVVKLAFFTMSANGSLAPGHEEQLLQLQRTLQIPDDQYRALIELISQPQEDTA